MLGGGGCWGKGAYLRQKQQHMPSLRNKGEHMAHLRKEAHVAEAQKVRRGVRRGGVRKEGEVEVALRRKKSHGER